MTKSSKNKTEKLSLTGFYQKTAFTIAETMIALLIVGVIAAMVIPMLQHGYKVSAAQVTLADAMKEFNKGLFNYTASSQGVRVSEGEGAKDALVLSTTFDGKLSSNGLFNEDNPAEKLATQFHPIKTGVDCWEGVQIRNSFAFSGGGTTDLSLQSCFIDGDNIIYAIEKFPDNCSTDFYNNAVGTRHKLKKTCGILYIDINGQKAPNSFGRDVFAYLITDASNAYLYPVGGKLMKPILNNESVISEAGAVSSWVGSCDEEHKDGRTCAGRIAEEGMRIKYWK